MACRCTSSSTLPAAAREGKTPFVWSTDDDKHLIKLAVSATIVHLVEERRKYWRTLQYLGGQRVAKLDAEPSCRTGGAAAHSTTNWRPKREASLDSDRPGMSELAASSERAGIAGLGGASAGFGGAASPAKAAAPAAAAKANGSGRWSRFPRTTSKVHQLQDLLSGRERAVREDHASWWTARPRKSAI